MIDRVIPEPPGYLDGVERNGMEMFDRGRVCRDFALWEIPNCTITIFQYRDCAFLPIKAM